MSRNRRPGSPSSTEVASASAGTWFRFRTLALVAGLAVLLSAVPASADLVIEGQKKVRRDAIVDFGPYADYSTWNYVVKKGDTLSEIAQHQLGTMKRASEITKLNPGLTAKTLKANEKILMPPRKIPVSHDPAIAKTQELPKDAQMWWEFYGALWGGSGGFERVGSGEAVPHHHYWTALIAIRHDKVGELKSVLSQGGRGMRTILEATKGKDWIAVAEQGLTGYTSLDDTSPIHRIVDNFRVEKIADGRITLKKVDSKKLDKEDKDVSSAGFFGSGWNLLLLFLAFSGLLGLAIVISRRHSGERVQIPVSS